MTMRRIFVPWWAGHASNSVLETALAVARHVNAHLDVVYIQPDQGEIMTALSNAALGAAGMAEQIEACGRGAAEDALKRFTAWRKHQNLSSETVNDELLSSFARWSERAGLPEQVIVRKGRLSDMTVLGFPGQGSSLDRALDAALFETGRPVLLVPADGEQNPLRHVVIAWNGSLEATRALVGAMPLLYKAEQVTVLTTPGFVDDAFTQDQVAGDLDLAEALQWHGIRAGHYRVVADTTSAGSALLQVAGEREASLLVMGAYTHSRVTAAFLGGVTGRILLNPPPFPVLMGH